MKLLPKKALLVALSLGMPLAHASNTDSSSSYNKLKVAFGTLAAFVATKAAYNSCYRDKKEKSTVERYNEIVRKEEKRIAEKEQEARSILAKMGVRYENEFYKNKSLDELIKISQRCREYYSHKDRLESLQEELTARSPLDPEISKNYNAIMHRSKLEKQSWFTLKYEGTWFPRFQAFAGW